jgi:hypothetical protein
VRVVIAAAYEPPTDPPGVPAQVDQMLASVRISK